jgi:uncharacterized protein (DUF1684 family)
VGCRESNWCAAARVAAPGLIEQLVRPGVGRDGAVGVISSKWFDARAQRDGSTVVDGGRRWRREGRVAVGAAREGGRK